MDKGTIGSIDEHDGKKHDWIYPHQNTNGRTDKVCIGRLEKKMGMGHTEIHLFRTVMRGVKTPKQTDFVGEEMIDEMSKFPDNISVKKPIPGHRNFDQRKGLKHPNTKSYHPNSDKPSQYPIGEVN